MTDRTTSNGSPEFSLQGRHVALAGRLASLTRAQALKLIASRGGTYSPTVTRRTSAVVVGLGGIPLESDGRVSRKLQRAAEIQRLGHPLDVLREDEWLDRLGLHDGPGTVRRRYSLDQIAALLKIPAGKVRSWIRVGLIEPAEDREGVSCFDFGQVASLKRLDELTQAGVTSARLRRGLSQLATWLPEATESLTRLDLFDRRRLVIRGDDGALADPTGQRLFEFAVPPECAAVRYEERPLTADELFAKGVSLEQGERLEEAEEAYRNWLGQFGPDSEVTFNLANVLYRQGKVAAAVERYRQAVEIDPDSADAWTNLGSVLAELGRHEESLAATRRALRVDPSNGNALYNLADTLDELGRTAEARAYWEQYLAQDNEGPWSEYARGRVEQRAV